MSANRMCQCTRCRNKHLESERIEEPRKGDAFASEMCCPRCRCRSYYDITPAKAWCSMSGVIVIGRVDEDQKPDGASDRPIFFATGPYGDLKARIDTYANRERGSFVWTVPGMPEAKDEKDALALLRLWVSKCAVKTGTRYARGVVFELKEVV